MPSKAGTLEVEIASPLVTSFASDPAGVIPVAASPQQLKALHQERHAADLIKTAKSSCRNSLKQRGRISFVEAQQDLLQSCILMNTMLEQWQQRARLSSTQMERSTITRYQLRSLIQDLLHYGDEVL